jgi:hypothetical protein
MPSWRANSVKNTFYSAIRRNLQRFNKWKKPKEPIRDLVEIPLEKKEIRKILTAENNITAIHSYRKNLSKSA